MNPTTSPSESTAKDSTTGTERKPTHAHFARERRRRKKALADAAALRELLQERGEKIAEQRRTISNLERRLAHAESRASDANEKLAQIVRVCFEQHDWGHTVNVRVSMNLSTSCLGVRSTQALLASVAIDMLRLINLSLSVAETKAMVESAVLSGDPGAVNVLASARSKWVHELMMNPEARSYVFAIAQSKGTDPTAALCSIWESAIEAIKAIAIKIPQGTTIRFLHQQLPKHPERM